MIFIKSELRVLKYDKEELSMSEQRKTVVVIEAFSGRGFDVAKKMPS